MDSEPIVDPAFHNRIREGFPVIRPKETLPIKQQLKGQTPRANTLGYFFTALSSFPSSCRLRIVNSPCSFFENSNWVGPRLGKRIFVSDSETPQASRPFVKLELADDCLRGPSSGCNAENWYVPAYPRQNFLRQTRSPCATEGMGGVLPVCPPPQVPPSSSRR